MPGGEASAVAVADGLGRAGEGPLNRVGEVCFLEYPDIDVGTVWRGQDNGGSGFFRLARYLCEVDG